MRVRAGPVAMGSSSRSHPQNARSCPPITGGLLQGGDYDSRQLLGMVVVYNVWDSWCVPCREEAPALRKVSRQTRPEGVRFVGINVRDNDASALAFERRYEGQVRWGGVRG